MLWWWLAQHQHPPNTSKFSPVLRVGVRIRGRNRFGTKPKTNGGKGWLSSGFVPTRVVYSAFGEGPYSVIGRVGGVVVGWPRGTAQPLGKDRGEDSVWFHGDVWQLRVTRTTTQPQGPAVIVVVVVVALHNRILPAPGRFACFGPRPFNKCGVGNEPQFSHKQTSTKRILPVALETRRREDVILAEPFIWLVTCPCHRGKRRRGPCRGEGILVGTIIIGSFLAERVAGP